MERSGVWLDQNIDRVTWTAIMLAIGISLYALFSPYLASMDTPLLNIADQTSIMAPSTGSNVDYGSGSGAGFTENSDGSYLYN